MGSSINTQAQYRLSPYPDLWYNDIDGIRLGLRVLGEVEGTFKDGPHRLDAGVWVGSKLPDNPISYYLSFTEPIPAFSKFGGEGNLQLISLTRTGFSKHQLSFNKRWQRGFEELDHTEISLFFSRQIRYNSNYLLNRYLWRESWLAILGTEIFISEDFKNGRFATKLAVQGNVDQSAVEGEFWRTTVETEYRRDFNESVKLRIRSFAGIVSSFAQPEFKFLATSSSPIEWVDQGFSRANGLISTNWMNSGNIHFDGGGNLRGYQNETGMILKALDQTVNGQFKVPLHHKIIAFNIDLEFPNPLNTALKKIRYFGDIVEFRSYSFFDIGQGVGNRVVTDPNAVQLPNIVPPEIESVFKSGDWLMDAGLGFQFSANIPDYLGKDRGIFIRYDIPFWLSSPSNNESNFKYRNVVGIGAIFNF